MVGRICGTGDFKSGMEERRNNGWCDGVTDDERG